MKKILSLILTFAMVFSLAMPAMAADNTTSDVTASYTPTYSITVSTDANGAVTANPTAAAEGTLVTLTVTPNSGYELDALIIHNGAITATRGEDGKYTFTMPASAVTVSATFKVAVQKYAIDIYKASTDYAAGIVTGTITSDVSEAAEGETVQLFAHPSDGYVLRAVVVTYVVSGQTQYINVNKNDLNFIMPAYDVDVMSYFDPIPTEPKITSLYITVDGERYDSTNTSAENPVTIYNDSTYSVIVSGTDFNKLSYTTTAVNPSIEFAKGNTAFLGSGEWNINHTENIAIYAISSMNVMKDTSDTFEIGYANFEDTIDETSQRDYHGSGVYIVYVDSMKPVYYNVKIAGGITNGTIIANPTSAAESATITLTVTPAEGYELDALTINDGEITATKGTDGNYTFTMPASDVTVNATFKKINYTITVSSSENGSVTAPATATMGETVKLTWTTDAAYELGDISVKDANDKVVSITEKGLTEWTFVMPASNVTITATFNKLPITSAEIVWGSMAFTYSDEQVVQADGSTADKGWSNDGSEGAGTVTVKNTGDNTFTAQVAYTAVTEYDEIAGTFDATSAELTTEASKTFTLTLKNKPEKAITAGTKIGEVTITINEAAEG